MDRVFFLSSRGLYAVQASGEGLQPISENAIPEELTGVDDEGTVLAYSHADRGVYIHIPSANVSWFFDTERQNFWPFTLDRTSSHLLTGPFKIGDVDGEGIVSAMRGVIASGSDTVHWRIVAGDTAEDAATKGKAAIETFLSFPGSEASYSQHVKYSGSWNAGRSWTSRPRVRAVWVCLWLHSDGEWAFEKSSIQIATAGVWRG